jgi:hypothetical protein
MNTHSYRGPDPEGGSGSKGRIMSQQDPNQMRFQVRPSNRPGGYFWEAFDSTMPERPVMAPTLNREEADAEAARLNQLTHARPKKHAGRTKQIIIAAVAGAVLFFTGVAVGSAGSAGTDATNKTASGKPAASTAPTTAPEPVVEETTPAPPPESTYGTPTKTDFKLTAKVLSKKCFGSAGCNLTYRIIISYTGPDLDPSKSYEVLYEVRGGEDGPATNTFTVTGGESSVDEKEFVSTKKTSSKLTAVVTDVL